ncbi:MAG TPA: hypothetical protein VIH89_18040 [Candidatus Sulfotelmatobacter sp.]
MSNGAVYIITQDRRYVDLLLTSAASLKRAMPDLPITVFSQFPVESAYFERVIPVQPTQDGFYDKTTLIRQMPYERTLFIDADTYVVEPVPELFSVLDRFDCAATHEEYVNTDWFNRYPRLDIPASFPEFNTGIMALKRSEKMDRFLESWGELYQSFLAEKPGQPINDQPFFRAAAYASDVRIATLTREYNCKFRGQGYLNGTVKIIHGHVKFQLTVGQANRAINVLNASKKPRVYIAGTVYEQKLVGRLVSRRKAHKVGSFPELPGSIMLMRANRLKEVIKERGIRNTLAKVFAAK